MRCPGPERLRGRGFTPSDHLMTDKKPAQSRIERFESYVAADPGNPLLRITLGDQYVAAGALDKARDCYEACLKTDLDMTARSRIASVFMAQGRLLDAEAVLISLADSGQGDPVLSHNLGMSFYEQGDWAKASHYFRQASAARSPWPASYAYLARSLHYLGELDEAVEACKSWCALTADEDSKAYLALLTFDQGGHAEASLLARQVLALNPRQTLANAVAGWTLLARSETDAARRHFEAAVHEDALNDRTLVAMGLLHLQKSALSEAIGALEQAARMNPFHAGTLLALGWAQLSINDFASAERSFEQAVALDRTLAERRDGTASTPLKPDMAALDIKLAGRFAPHGFGMQSQHRLPTAMTSEDDRRESETFQDSEKMTLA